MKRLPLVPTVLVAAAVALLCWLGVWQIHRAAWKKDLLARYDAAAHLPPVAWPSIRGKPEAYYFRKASGFCLQVTGWRSVAGRNLRDEPGWSHIAACSTGAEGPGMQVDVGWSTLSGNPRWSGGPVDGVIAPDRKFDLRLVAATPAPGLQPSQPPSREGIPNNHILYAIQWFAFALMALVFYVLALRKKWKEEEDKENEKSRGTSPR